MDRLGRRVIYRIDGERWRVTVGPEDADRLIFAAVVVTVCGIAAAVLARRWAGGPQL